MLFHMEFTKSVLCFMKDNVPIGSGVIIVFDKRIFLCTCKHVVQSIDNAPNSIMVNNKSLSKNQFAISSENFKCHKDADIAICNIDISQFIDAESDVKWITKDSTLFYGSPEFSDLGMGDSIFALGFPLQFTGNSKNYPILRGGVIARMDKECIEQDKCFWIDSNIFPGNSGGPVVLKPEASAIEPTKSIDRSYLLGIVSGYKPYVDVLISQQTKQVVSRIEEHSGLSQVVPIHYAKEIYDEHFAKTVSD